MKNGCYFLILCLVNFNAKCHELLSFFLFYIYVFDSNADYVVLDSTGIDSVQAGIRVRTKHVLILHPRIRIDFTPESESESIPLIQSRNRNRFRQWMTDSGPNVPKCLFATIRSAPGCDFYSDGRLYSYACCQKPHLFIVLTLFRGGSVMDPALWNQNGIDSGVESPESESILFNWPESQSGSAPCFLAESDSISVSWDQAQFCPTQYEKCKTSVIC